MSARQIWLWLAECQGVGALAISGLLAAFGSPEAIYAADRKALATAYPLRKTQVDALCDKSLARADRIAEECAKKNISILTLADDAYPDRLRAIADPPPVLYVRGRWPDFDAVPGIAVVGMRESTQYGDDVAQRIGRTLATAGFITVSGMARGIDGMAQRAALRTGGTSVAVLAGGVDICYPQENRALMGDILLAGALISEHPPGTAHEGRFFPSRNRIISGLTVATVVVEAATLRSGSIITAHHALEQGRDVYAVPAGVDASASSGCLQLIERGEAALLADPMTLVSAYGGLLPRQPDEARVKQAFVRQTGMREAPFEKSAWDDIEKREARGNAQRKASAADKPQPLPAHLSEEERLIAELIRQGASTPTDILERCELPAARVMSIVTMLELDGVLGREKGRLILH